MRRTTTVIAGLAGALMLGAGSASAAEIVGADLTLTPDDGLDAPFSWVLATPATGSAFPAKASSGGVVTSLRVKHAGSGANPGALTFRILNGTPPTYTARSHPRLADFPATANAQAGTITIIPRDAGGSPQGVPIAAGERISIGQVGGVQGLIFLELDQSPGAFANFKSPTPNLADGSLTWGTTGPGAQPLLQYTVERDADFDSYGDETQDANVSSACTGLTPTHTGTAGNDVIFGTAGNDVIVALAGNDIVRGLGGDDTICGGDGNDKLKGGAGKDRLFGEAGRDKLNGGGAKDICFGGTEKDAIGCEKAKQK